MNPFFIFLILCTLAALGFWFKNATPKQGVTALKGFLIITAIVIVILMAIGRLPYLIAIPLMLLGLYRKIALAKLLIPLIRILAGRSNSPTAVMETSLALSLLDLPPNPSREDIVQAHRGKARDIKSSNGTHKHSLTDIDAAREFLIQQLDKPKH